MANEALGCLHPLLIGMQRAAVRDYYGFADPINTTQVGISAPYSALKQNENEMRRRGLQQPVGVRQPRAWSKMTMPSGPDAEKPGVPVKEMIGFVGWSLL